MPDKQFDLFASARQEMIDDVDSDVSIGSPIDQHAAEQTTSVYTGIRTFPMLPEELSTGLTSL